MKFTILGCGSSMGVPRADGFFGKCNPKNKKNYRTRCSALLQSNNANILIDTSPDLRMQLLSNKIRIDGLINVYDDLFFEFFNGEIPNKPRVKYISDSNHKWKYGSPLEAIDDGCRKLQILFHPFSWSEKGGNNLDNYLSLIKEKNLNLINSIDAEMSNFPLDEIMKKLEM